MAKPCLAKPKLYKVQGLGSFVNRPKLSLEWLNPTSLTLSLVIRLTFAIAISYKDLAMEPNKNNLQDQSCQSSTANNISQDNLNDKESALEHRKETRSSHDKAHDQAKAHDLDKSEVDGNVPDKSKVHDQGMSSGNGQSTCNGQSRGYGKNLGYDDEDDYGLPPKKISYEEALALSKQQQGLVSIISMLQVIVVCVFMCGFVGYVKGDGDLKEANVAERLVQLAGPLADQGAMGVALWFMLSSLVGGIALLIPMAIYNAIARSADRSQGQSAGVTLYDVIRAEILKYALMIIILALAFKFTALNGLVIMATFVIVMFSQIIKSSLSLGRRS